MSQHENSRITQKTCMMYYVSGYQKINKRRCERRRATKKGKKREKAVNREKEEIEKK